RGGNGPEARPQKRIGGELGGLLFNRPCDDTFGMIMSGARQCCSHGGVSPSSRCRPPSLYLCSTLHRHMDGASTPHYYGYRSKPLLTRRVPPWRACHPHGCDPAASDSRTVKQF